MGNQLFDFLRSEHGPLDPKEPVPADFADRMSGRLPESLIAFLRENGFGAWKQGRFQFCDPEPFDPVLDDVLSGDPDLAPRDCAAFGYSAFGSLLVWHRTHQNVTVNLPLAEVKAPRLSSGQTVREDVAATSNLMDLDADVHDQHDADGKVLFKRALKTLGPLELGQCYGFFPALALGGSAKLDGLKRVSALEHFALLAQSADFRLMDYSKRPAFVRDIG